MNLKISALDYIHCIQQGEFTVEDFISETIYHIQAKDGDIHAMLSINDTAISKAREIDKKIKTGEDVGACLGLPISIKDNICVKDSPTTCASMMLKDFVAPYDATVVSRLREQDAIFVGKTNLDEFAMGLTTEFSAFGPTKNPWHVDYVPGGSSGGSAAAVCAFECIASLGSDTGGSVRNPASFCSVVGYKPTYGLLSRYGLISYANSIEQIGPITRTVKDAAFLLNIIAGYDINDNTTINHTQDYLEDIDQGIKGRKIGIVKEMCDGCDPRVSQTIDIAIAKLQSCGAICEYVSLDMVRYSVAAYYVLTAAEAGSNLARYDNIRYGYDFGVEGYEFNSYIKQARRRFGPEVTRRMILGGFVPSVGYKGKYLLKALKIKKRLEQEVSDIFKHYDLLLGPTVPMLPFPIGSKIDDPVELFKIDINTVTANLTNRPAISVPCAICDGLPVGIQLMADSLQDKLLLRAARTLEKTTNLQEVPI